MSLSQSTLRTFSGTITTQNLVPSGVATANSAVVAPLNTEVQTVGIQVSGTYTSGAAGTLFGLVVQASIDGITWFTVEKFAQIATGVGTSTPAKLWKSNIPSGAVGLYLVKNEGFSFIRVCCTSGAMTGTATITLKPSYAMFPSDVEYARYKTMSNGPITHTAAVTAIASIRGSNTSFVRVLNLSPRGSDHGSFISSQLGVLRIDYKVASALSAGTLVGNGNTVSKSDPNLSTRSATPEFRSTSATTTQTAYLASAGWAHTSTSVSGNYAPTKFTPSWDDTKPLYVLRSNAEWVYADTVIGTSFGGGAVAFYEIEWEEY
jgi:hypothetical protein